MTGNNLDIKIENWVKKFISKKDDYILKDLINKEDLSKVNNSYIKKFKNYSSWCFKPDYAVIVENINDKKLEIILINRIKNSIGLRQIGEIMCFNKIVNPIYSFLISNNGHSEEISMFMINKDISEKLLNYKNGNLIMFAFDDDSEMIRKNSIIPIKSRKAIYE